MQEKSRRITAKQIISIISLILFLTLAIYRYVELVLGEAYLDDIDVKYSYHFIDVGQGDCAMIKSEEATIVVDSGPVDHTYTTVEYIKQLTDEIDVMILTHPHEDHIGAAVDIIERVGVKTIIMPDAASESVCFEKLLDAIEKYNCKVEKGKAGKSFTVGDIDIELYAPNSDEYVDTNNYSIIAKVITGDISTIITGDAESSAEKEALDNFPAYVFDADILKVGHHGSSASTSKEFLEAVSPEYAMISCGEGNSYGHPNYSVLQLLKKYNIKYYRTDRMGSIACYSDGKRIVISESYTSGEDYPQS